MARGGLREGAGRKAKEPTQRIRVPLSLIDEVKDLIAEQKELLLRQYPNALDVLFEKQPDIQNNMTHVAHIALILENWDGLKGLPKYHKKAVIKLLK